MDCNQMCGFDSGRRGKLFWSRSSKENWSGTQSKKKPKNGKAAGKDKVTVTEEWKTAFIHPLP